MANVYDITIDQGATFALSMLFRDSEEVPIDLTGATIEAQIRPDADSKNILANITCGIDEETTGRLLLSLDPEKTTNLNFETAAYDVLVTFPDGTAMRAVQGKVTLSKQITR